MHTVERMPDAYPAQVDVEYPDRPLNRLTTGLRIFTIIPIAIVLGTVSGETWTWYGGTAQATTRPWSWAPAACSSPGRCS